MINNFVGRELIFEAISRFITRYTSGYFTIAGVPGSGKTAIANKYVTDNPQALYYDVRVRGNNEAEVFISDICKRINQDSEQASLSGILQEASDRLKPDQKLIIVIDGLDAADRASQTPGSNVFYLPRYLPTGVYFIVTRRPYPREKSGLLIEAPSEVLDLGLYPENCNDTEAYIRQQMNDETLVVPLKATSENNFMYLSQIFANKEFGGLPTELETYYQQHLERMIPFEISSEDRELKLSVLNELQQFSSVKAIASKVGVDEFAVGEVLEDWWQFLIIQEADGLIQYRLYHSSFIDFTQAFLYS